MPLIIIEPKGFLYRKTDLVDNRLENTAAENCMVFSKHRLIFREGTRDFLEFLFNRYTVGFYSSLPKKVLKQILKLLLTPEQYGKTLFIWGEYRLRLDLCRPGFKTYKSIKDIFENPEINCNRQWNTSNVLFLDTNCKKLEEMPPENVCLIKKFSGSSHNLYLYDLMSEIPKFYFDSSSVLDGMLIT